MTGQYLAFNRAIADETNRFFVEDAATPLAFTPTTYTQPIDDWTTAPTSQFISVNAVAGSGKTRQLRRAASLLGGGIKASTLHSAGLRLLSPHLDQRADVQNQKYRNIAREYLEANAGLKAGFRSIREATACLMDLLDLARLALASPDDPIAFREAAARWACECPEGFALATRKILKAGAQQAEKTGVIDFTDMIYLPYRWDIHPEETLDWILADEVQDFSAAQLDLILRHLGEHSHGVFVGDPRQSIMGFAFAAYDSYAQVQQRLQSKELPLSICWRCPPNHLNLAREIVPQIEAKPGRTDGLLNTDATLDDVYSDAERGDLIICRRTIPLITLAASLIQQNKPARIKGRDFGASIIGHLEELSHGHDASRDTLLRELGRWYGQELKALENRDAPASATARLDGKMEMTAACIEAAPDPGNLYAVEGFVRSLFDDNGGGSNPIWLSTIHRAKGLEADRVWVLDADTLGQPFPKQTAEEAQQEINLRYVALTRSKEALHLVQSKRR